MHVLHCVVCRMWLHVCDAHYVYVHVVKEEAMGVCCVCQPIQCVYRIRIKVEAKD